MRRGSAVRDGAEGAGDRAWAACCHALSCSREHLGGICCNPEQQLPGDPFVRLHLLARERDGWGGMVWKGCLRVSADRGVSALLFPSGAALYNSSKDEESQVSSLAVQTMDMLRISWTRPRLRGTLWALCCCL